MRAILAAVMAAASLATARFSGVQARTAAPVGMIRIRDRPTDIVGTMITAGLPFQTWAPRIIPRGKGYSRHRGPHQGSGETARRRRQIKKLTLTGSNGLVLT